MKYKSIGSTYVFKQFKNNLAEIIQELLTTSQVLSQKELEEQFLMMKKYINSPLKPKILNELQTGNIKLLYAPEDVGKLTFLPFVMTIEQGRLCANVLVSSFGNMRQDGLVSIDYRKLYTLIESSYYAKQFLLKYQSYKNNSDILTEGSRIYSNMFVKPINKKFNLHLDKNREDTLLFLSAKFYLKNVIGIQSDEIIFNTAMKVCKAGNPILLKEADLVIPEEAYKNLGVFLEAIKDDKLNLGLSGLTARGFMESYISLYGSGTVFGLEMFPYFLYVINASLNSRGLVNNYSLEDLTEKGGARLLSRLLN